MSEESPRRAVVLIAKIEADSRRDLVSHLLSLATNIECGEHYGSSISGGCSSGHVLHLSENDEPTHDAYFQQITRWLADLKERAHD